MIEELTKQLSFEPSVIRPLKDIPATIVVGGMGGSGYTGDALAYLMPGRNIIVHRDYGIPQYAPEDALYIAVSYSGTTEETLSFVNEAHAAGKRLAVVASGGALAAFAEREGLTAALVPHGLQPRHALVYQLRAVLAILREEALLTALASLTVDAEDAHDQAEELAHFILPSVPLFYSSRRNALFASLGKIMMNETARTPAFSNVFSELNHNEMQSFDTDMPEGLEHLFRFVLVKDARDGVRIARRMDAFTELMRERGRLVEELDIGTLTEPQALVMLWIRFVLMAQMLAETRGIDTSTVPLIEAFKKRI